RPTVGMLKEEGTSDNVTEVMMNRRIAQGAATRGHLLEVATGLFTDQGYEQTSIEDVLRTAGVSRGSLYHHFAGKDRLFEAVVEHLLLGALNEAAMLVARARTPSRARRDAVAAVDRLIDGFLR